MKNLSKLTSLVLMICLSSTAFAGKIVVNHDEWTLSNLGFSSSPDAGIFVDNVTDFFTGGTPANVHAYSTNFSLNQSALGTAMVAAGNTYTTGTAITFDLPTLQTYDAIFLAGNAPGFSTSVLVDYVNGGGNVYLAGGTGVGGAVAEAAFWNGFLTSFGLEFQSPYNGLSGNFDVSSAPHQIFDGVSTLYENNGNSVLELVATDPNTAVYFGGRYAVYDDTAVSVPEPAIISLLVAGLFGLALRRRRIAQS